VPEELSERCSDGGIPLDEPAIIAGEPEEPTQTGHGTGLRPRGDSLDLVLVHGDAG